MGIALVGEATSTSTVTPARKKVDMGGSKKPIVGFSCPIIKRGKNKKRS